MFVGIDVGADRLHAVSIDDDGEVTGKVCAAAEIPDLVDWAARARVVAIDAPAGLSGLPHAHDQTLSPKFQKGRCAEIALGRQHGIWVSWVTPAIEPVDGWMATGTKVYRAFGELPACELIEVYPHGAFRALAGGAMPAKKTSAAGVRQRAELLREAGVAVEELEMWSHDSLDAAVAAVVARQRSTGQALRVTCDGADAGFVHDGSAIWLPTR